MTAGPPYEIEIVRDWVQLVQLVQLAGFPFSSARSLFSVAHTCNVDDVVHSQAKGVGGGRQGYIPSNYVSPAQEMTANEWFHGKIPRQKAERIIMADGRLVVAYCS